MHNYTPRICNLSRQNHLVNKYRPKEGVQHEINIIYCLQTTQEVPGGGCNAGPSLPFSTDLWRAREGVSASIMTTASQPVVLFISN